MTNHKKQRLTGLKEIQVIFAKKLNQTEIRRSRIGSTDIELCMMALVLLIEIVEEEQSE